MAECSSTKPRVKSLSIVVGDYSKKTAESSQPGQACPGWLRKLGSFGSYNLHSQCTELVPKMYLESKICTKALLSMYSS